MADTSYDEVPYPSLPHRDTRPDRLELIGRLCGLSPPPAARARVLEIGCAVGGNLLPMAERFPEARFVGIDISPRQIEIANETARAAGVSNVELRTQDLVDVNDGEFDYIIAHGVYSWVPDPVKARLLDVCGERLAPNGIAFVSHNVKPGWYARAAVRGMMLYHTANITSSPERIREARSLLSFLAAGARPNDQQFKAQLATQIDLASALPDEIFFHDYIADVNDASFFHEFVAGLPPRGLQFLADAEIESMFGMGFPPEIRRALAAVSTDVIRREQYLDFLKNRAFRMTLLCRSELQVTRRFAASELADVRFASRAVPEEGANLTDGLPVLFRTRNAGARVPTPFTKGLLARLGSAFPRTFSIEELAADNPEALPTLAQELMGLFSAAMVELSLGDDPFVVPAPETPRATPLARIQAARGEVVTTMRHEGAALEDDERRLLALLDGRDRAALARELPGVDVPTLLERLARNALVA